MTCWKINKTDLLLEKQCPYCKHFFSSGKETKKHMKTCIYNQDNIHHISSEFSIYSEQIN